MFRPLCGHLADLCLALALSLALGGCRDRQRTGEPVADPAESATPSSSAPLAFAPRRVEHRHVAMGTTVQLVGYTTERLDEAGVRAAFSASAAEIERLEGVLSEWRPDTEVGRINAQAGEWVPIGDELARVLDKSLWASRVSEGTFDITFQVMSDVWKFGTSQDPTPALPPAREIARRRARIDYRKLELDRDARRVRIPKDFQIGLGGIAKGYIVDRAAAVLAEHGVRAYLVQAGGDLYGAGKKPDGSPWVSGIQDPRGPAGSYFATIALEDHAFSTAGDYARSFVVDGRRYHHIIDPRTGYPATASRSVTVWAKDAFTADAIDDAVFILGPEKGLKLVESLEGVGAVIVDRDNRVHVSRRLQGKVDISKPPTPGD